MTIDEKINEALGISNEKILTKAVVKKEPVKKAVLKKESAKKVLDAKKKSSK